MQGAICTSSGRFKRIEPQRTFSNYIQTQRARYIDFFHTSSGWFDWTEPSPTTSLQGIQGVQGAKCTSSRGSRKSNLLEREIVRYGTVRYGSSGWFDWTEPSLTTSLQGLQAVQGTICTSSRGSSTSNLIEPTRTIFSQR